MAGCLDDGDNATDFVTAPPAPRNSSSPAAFCGCATDINLSESDEPAEADFCNVQDPAALTVSPGAETGDIFGRIYEQNVTEAGGAPTNLRAQVGYAKGGTPVQSAHWAWFEAAYNVQHGNDDEYMGRITYSGMSSGSNAYSYVYRFSWDDGQSWTYCDVDGAGSNGGLSFDLSAAGQMTVQ